MACEYCTVGCSGGCGTYCGWCDGGCKGCGTACSSDCTGCSGTCTGGCSGCRGCGGVCSSNCSGCDGCSGCGGACSSSCTACSGTCSGGCDNGCTATGMAEAFNNLGIDIIVNAIVYASDVGEVQDFVLRELSRRSLTPAAAKDTLTPEKAAQKAAITHIWDNCKVAGYTGAAPAAVVPTAAEVQAYVTYAKTLYNKILRA